MKVIGKDVDNLTSRKFIQSKYVTARRTKVFYNFGKWRWRSRTRQAKSVRYKIKVIIFAKSLKTGKRGKYTGTSHLINYYSSKNAKQGFKEALSQAKVYAVRDLQVQYDEIIFTVLQVKVLRLKFRRGMSK